MEMIAIFNPDNNNFNSKEKHLIVGQVQSGKTKFMIKKTHELLSEKKDCVIILGGNVNSLLEQTKYRFLNEFDDFDFEIFDIKNTIFEKIPDKKTIIFSLKGKDSLEKLIELIENSNEKNIYIFDDESDFGSVNVSKNENGSKLYSQLIKIYSLINKGIYFSVTATPYANLLIDSKNEFDKIELLIPNNDYKGLNFFEKNNNIYVVNEKYSEKKINDNDLVKILIDHIERVHYSKLEKSQLLINFDLDTNNQEKLFHRIFNILNEISYMPTTSLFHNNNNNNNYRKILLELKDNLFLFNGKSNDKFNKNSHSLIIGGSLVSRGYTFNELITTIMFNGPKKKNSADTLLQRARWFGYRNDFYKYMKVYMTPNIRNAYKECEILQNSLINMINDNLSINEIKNNLKNILNYEYIELTGKRKNNEK